MLHIKLNNEKKMLPVLVFYLSLLSTVTAVLLGRIEKVRLRYETVTVYACAPRGLAAKQTRKTTDESRVHFFFFCFPDLTSRYMRLLAYRRIWTTGGQKRTMFHRRFRRCLQDTRLNNRMHILAYLSFATSHHPNT